MAHTTQTSKQQDITIDSLLFTHRELACVEECEYELQPLAMGPIYLIIKTNGRYYHYKLMKNGAIAETRVGEKRSIAEIAKYFAD